MNHWICGCSNPESHAGNHTARCGHHTFCWWPPHALSVATTHSAGGYHTFCRCLEPVAEWGSPEPPTVGRNLRDEGDSAPRDRVQNISVYFWRGLWFQQDNWVHVAWQFLFIWLHNTQLAPKGIEAPVLFPVLLSLSYLPSTLKNEY